MKASAAKKIIQDYKSRPCADCVRDGILRTWPAFVMDLHHARGVKLFTLAKVSRGIEKLGISLKQLTEEMLRRELAKCDPLCANHHRIRTKQQQLERGDNKRSAKERVQI